MVTLKRKRQNDGHRKRHTYLKGRQQRQTAKERREAGRRARRTKNIRNRNCEDLGLLSRQPPYHVVGGFVKQEQQPTTNFLPWEHRSPVSRTLLGKEHWLFGPFGTSRGLLLAKPKVSNTFQKMQLCLGLAQKRTFEVLKTPSRNRKHSPIILIKSFITIKKPYQSHNSACNEFIAKS